MQVEKVTDAAKGYVTAEMAEALNHYDAGGAGVPLG